MANAQHTPGPWHWQRNKSTIAIKGSSLIATISGGGINTNIITEEKIANARLLAAAPSMKAFVELVAAGHLTQQGFVDAAKRMLEHINSEGEQS